jgi:hypothetical protein
MWNRARFEAGFETRAGRGHYSSSLMESMESLDKISLVLEDKGVSEKHTVGG